jgi:hypothetical protein
MKIDDKRMIPWKPCSTHCSIVKDKTKGLSTAVIFSFDLNSKGLKAMGAYLERKQ